MSVFLGVTPNPPPPNVVPGNCVFFGGFFVCNVHISIIESLLLLFTIIFSTTCKLCFIPAAYNRTVNGWLKWNANEYKIVSDTMSIEQARQHCKKENSNLVSITSEAESILLWNVVSRIPCWLNAHNKVQQDFCFHLVSWCAIRYPHGKHFSG